METKQPSGPQEIKVLHCVAAFHLGGAEKVVLQLCRKLKALQGKPLKHGVVAMLPQTDEVGLYLIQELKAAGAEVFFASQLSRNIARFTAAYGLKKIIESFQPDLIHSHTDIPDFNVSVAYRLGWIGKSIKLIRTIHNTELWPGRPRFAQWVEEALDDSAVQAISTPTFEAYKSLRKNSDLALALFNSIIPIPVDEGSNVVLEVAQELTNDSNVLKLCFAGRLTAQKGIDYLAKIVRRLGKERWYELSVFGNGHLLPLLEALVKEGYPVELRGADPFVANKFRNFDLVLLPSRFEGTPLVALEAGLRGVPLMASEAIAPILPPNYSYCLTADETEMWVNCIQEFKQMSKEVRASIGLKIQEHLKGLGYDWSVQQKQYEVLYSHPLKVLHA